MENRPGELLGILWKKVKIQMAKKRDKKRKCRNINPVRKEDKLSHDIPGTNTKESIKDKILSETILEFAQPLMDKCENADQQKKLIDLSVLAWNMSYLPKEQQEREKEKIIRKLGDDVEARLTVNEVFNYLIARKEALYSHEKRIIVNYEVSEFNDKLNLMVASCSTRGD